MEGPQPKAEVQLLCFCLIEDENLIRFTLHKVLHRQDTGREEQTLFENHIASLLTDYEHKNESKLKYANSAPHIGGHEDFGLLSVIPTFWRDVKSRRKRI